MKNYPKAWLILFLFQVTLIQAQDVASVEIILANASAARTALKYDSALFLYQMADELARDQKLWQLHVRAKAGASSVLIDLGNIQKSMSLAIEAHELGKLHLTEDDPILIRAITNLGLAQFSAGQLSEAEKSLESARSKYELLALGDSVLEGDIYFHLGNLTLFTARFESAQSYLNQSLSLRKSVFDEDHPKIAACYSSLGILHAEKWQYRKALRYFEKATAILENVGGDMSPALARSYGHLANAYVLLGDPSKSLDFHEQSLRIQERTLIPIHPQIGKTYMNMFIAQFKNGDLEESLKSNEKARFILEQGLGPGHPVVGTLLSNGSIAHMGLGQHQQALENLNRALKIQMTAFGEKSLDVARTFHNLGEVHSDLGDSTAVVHFNKAIKILLEVFDDTHVMLALSYNELGRYFHKQQQPDAALEYYQKALIVNVPDFSDKAIEQNPEIVNYQDPTILLETLRLKAESLFLRFRNGGSISDLKLALETLLLGDELINQSERHKSRIEDKYQLGEVSAKVYKEAISIAYELYQLDQALFYRDQIFYLMEKSRASVLRNKSRLDQSKLVGHLTGSLMELEELTQDSISYLRAQLTRASPINAQEKVEINTRIFNLKLVLDSLSRVFADHSQSYYALRFNPALPTINSISDCLDEDQAFVEYFDGGQFIYWLTISSETVEVGKIEKSKQLERAIQIYVNRLTHPPVNETFVEFFNDFVESSLFLNQYLLEPAIANLTNQVRKLIISPMNELAKMPWEFLLQDNTGIGTMDYRKLNYVLNDYTISYANSAYLRFRKPWKAIDQEAHGVLAMAPKFEQNLHFSDRSYDWLTDLKWNTKEVQNIEAYFDGKFLTGLDATELAFKEHFSQYQILHLSTHALLDETDFFESKLFFSPVSDSTEDNLLHIHELFNMNISPELTVLSACNTGQGVLQQGEGVMSLGNAFTYAGCPSTVLSLWPVDDQSTAKIMAHFYKLLARGDAKDVALRQAKMEFKKESIGPQTHPYYWGGFILIGDTDPVSAKQIIKPWMWLVAATILLMTFLVVKGNSMINKKGSGN